MQRHASAIWQGTLYDGRGLLSVESRALSNIPFSFKSRFGEGVTGTNPEEFIGAAHAGCFSMALAGELEKLNLKPEQIQTRARVQMEQTEEGWTVTKVHLQTTVQVPGGTFEQINQAAEAARSGCPISRLLKAQITMEAKLEIPRALNQDEMNY